MTFQETLIRYFCPDFCIDSIVEIDLERLRTNGISTLLIDLDNTIVSWRGKEISDDVIQWINKAKAAGFKLHIVSNSLQGRVGKLSRILDVPALSSGIKPRKKVFLSALKSMGSVPKESVIIGDQLFTDVFGGKRLGLHTILVSPIEKRELFTTGLLRIPEKLLLRFFRRRGLI